MQEVIASRTGAHADEFWDLGKKRGEEESQRTFQIGSRSSSGCSPSAGGRGATGRCGGGRREEETRRRRRRRGPPAEAATTGGRRRGGGARWRRRPAELAAAAPGGAGTGPEAAAAGGGGQGPAMGLRAGGAEEREAGEVARADWLRPVRPAGGGRVRRGARSGLGLVCVRFSGKMQIYR